MAKMKMEKVGKYLAYGFVALSAPGWIAMIPTLGGWLSAGFLSTAIMGVTIGQVVGAGVGIWALDELVFK